MRNSPLEYYEQWPFTRKAVVFLQAAKTLYEPQNRSWDNWEISYYLLSHSIELAIKAVAQQKTGKEPPRIHDKQELSEMYRNECGFNNEEMTIIRELKELNNGPGGLRYENEPIGDFYPYTFNKGVAIVERLITEKFQT